MADVETYIRQGTPMNYALGIDDKSPRQVDTPPSPIPQHVAVCPLFTRKGPTDLQIVIGGTRDKLYGSESFDENSDYATHQTTVANACNSAANSVAIIRLKPADAGPNANMLLYADVLTDEIPQYVRLPDGSFQLDPITREPVVDTTKPAIQGYKISYGIDHLTTQDDFTNLYGAAKQGVGSQQSASGVASVRYPLIQWSAPYFGSYGNLYGARIWAPTDAGLMPVNRTILSGTGVYPFRLAFVSMDNASSTAKPVPTLYGERSIEFTLKPRTQDKNTNKNLSLKEAVTANYTDASDPTMPTWESPLTNTYVYDDNVKALLSMILAAEAPHATTTSDFTNAPTADDIWKVNPFTALSSYGVPYASTVVNGPAGGGLLMAETTDLWMSGGSDGTMSQASYEKLALDEIAKFGDANDPYSEILMYPVSDVYDSGFATANKRGLVQFIANRKDTMVNLSTHTTGSKPLTASERSSLAVMLRSYVQAYPESEYFGTPTCRATILGGSGYKLGSVWSAKGGIEGRLPLTVWLAGKAARYMGAGDQRWKSAYAFDGDPGNKIDTFSDIDVVFTPSTVRHRDWANGLTYPQVYDHKQAFIAGLHTVYSDDTSVLMGYFTVRACMFLEKIGYEAWRKFTGNERLTAGALESSVKKFIEDRVIGLFDDRYQIQARCYHTKLDEQRGYSFHTEVTIFAPNMPTVQTYYLTARRLSDYTASSTK